MTATRHTPRRAARLLDYFRDLEGVTDDNVGSHECRRAARAARDALLAEHNGSYKDACRSICTDCVGDGADRVYKDVALCPHRDCPLHPVRLWWTPKPGSDIEKELAKLNAKWKIEDSRRKNRPKKAISPNRADTPNPG